MKKIASIVAAVGLAASGAAFAQKPVPMTDAQMDKVVGGLVTVTVIDVLNDNQILNDNQVVVNANVAAAVAVLGQAGAGAVQRAVTRR